MRPRKKTPIFDAAPKQSWVTFHVDERCGVVSEVKAWGTREAAESYLASIRLARECGYELHECHCKD